MTSNRFYWVDDECVWNISGQSECGTLCTFSRNTKSSAFSSGRLMDDWLLRWAERFISVYRVTCGSETSERKKFVCMSVYKHFNLSILPVKMPPFRLWKHLSKTKPASSHQSPLWRECDCVRLNVPISFCKTRLINSPFFNLCRVQWPRSMTVREKETGRGRATGNHFSVRAAERVGEQMKAHFPLIKSSENIPFVSATAAETGPGLHRQPTVSVDYVAATIYIPHWQHHHFLL